MEERFGHCGLHRLDLYSCTYFSDRFLIISMTASIIRRYIYFPMTFPSRKLGKKQASIMAILSMSTSNVSKHIKIQLYFGGSWQIGISASSLASRALYSLSKAVIPALRATPGWMLVQHQLMPHCQMSRLIYQFRPHKVWISIIIFW